MAAIVPPYLPPVWETCPRPPSPILGADTGAGRRQRGHLSVTARGPDASDDADGRGRVQRLVLEQPHPVEDVHATIFRALGIDFELELDTPIGRPMQICKGSPINQLFDS